MDQEQNHKLGELIRSIEKGNISAISEIYMMVGKAMFATAYTYVGNIADADDVVQDALVKIVSKASKFYTNKNAIAWINTIVSNIAKNKIGYSRRKKEVSIDKAKDLYSESNDYSFIIKEIFEILTEKERQYIIYVFWYECSLTELAKIFHRSKSNVDYHFKKIIEKIKKFYNILK